MALRIGFGGILLIAIAFAIMWYVNRKNRKIAEAKLAECEGKTTEEES